MRFEYILLLILSIFPLIYKLWYWQRVFLEYENNIRQFIYFLTSKQGRKQCSHFWTLLEIPIFLLAIVPIFNAPFEYFYYSILFYFLIIYNIFVLWKICRKKIYLPIKNIFLIQILSVIWVIFIIPVFFPVSIYLYITSILLCIPLYIIVTQCIIRLFTRKDL